MIKDWESSKDSLGDTLQLIECVLLDIEDKYAWSLLTNKGLSKVIHVFVLFIKVSGRFLLFLLFLFACAAFFGFLLLLFLGLLRGILPVVLVRSALWLLSYENDLALVSAPGCTTEDRVIVYLSDFI